MTELSVMILTAVEDVAEDVSSHSANIAAETGESRAAIHDMLVKEVKKRLHASRPDTVDARTGLYQVRIQLIPTLEGAGVEADTDPDLPDIDAPGSQFFYGLQAVAHELVHLAQQFHAGRTIEGLGNETLSHSIKAFRPTLSRLQGNAVWRPKYVLRAAKGETTQPVAGSLKGVTGGSRAVEHWSARVRIIRVASEKEPAR